LLSADLENGMSVYVKGPTILRELPPLISKVPHGAGLLLTA